MNSCQKYNCQSFLRLSKGCDLESISIGVDGKCLSFMPISTEDTVAYEMEYINGVSKEVEDV